MDGAKSLSQGVFLSLPPGFNLSKLKKNKKRKIEEDVEEWEQSFTKTWNSVEAKIKETSSSVYSKVLNNMVQHIERLSQAENTSEIIPCELLLTGTNLSDLKFLLSSLTRELKSGVTSNIAILWADAASNLKNAVQILVRQIVENESSSETDEFDEEDEEEEEVTKLRQTAQFSLSVLSAWYKENKKPIVVILPDFESYVPGVLNDLISLISTYGSSIRFILIFGVATSPSAVYQMLSRSVMSKLMVQFFTSEPSPSFLNHIIEKILLTDLCPFRLGGRTMTFLIDLFLFNTFSVQRFITGFKFCMMEHFYRKPYTILCCSSVEFNKNLDRFVEIESLRRLASFRNHVEQCDLAERKRLLLDDDYTKKFITEKLRALLKHTSEFHIVIKCLNILVKDLPGSPLGRQVREIYCRAVSNNILLDKDYKQAIALLRLQSKTELTQKLADVLDLLKNHDFGDVINKLEEFQLGLKETEKDVRNDLIHYLFNELFAVFLSPPMQLPLNEIFYFDDILAVRRRISGAPRSAIHNALNNPHSYLECECCQLSDLEAVTPSLPDLSIAYKLYLESNKTINLYDWLQSFAAVIQPDGQKEEITQQIQARFTRAVSELQFLGFIKSSRAKPDYVTRLTFGNF